MKRLLSISILIILAFSSIAIESDHEQILVFKNTGEVSLFYSDEIKSIECSNEDLSGNLHDSPVCQKFNLQDTTIIIPINEIDSVAFGSRNQIIPKVGARRLCDDDFNYIIRYQEDNIYYKSNTPVHLLPKINEKLYYNDFCDLFPVGLCAQVSSVIHIDGEIRVALVDLQPKDVFEAYFYAGEIENKHIELPRSRAEGEFEINIEKDNFSILYNFNISLKSRVIADILSGFYHVDVIITINNTLEAGVQADNSIHFESTPLTLKNITFGPIIQPRLQLALFLDLAGEIATKASFVGGHEISYGFTNHRNNITIDGLNYRCLTKDDDDWLKSKLETYLKGELHLGLLSRLILGVLFDRLGVGLEFKIGPKFEADFSVSVLQELSKEFSRELYAKGNIEVDKVNLKAEAFTFNPTSLFSHETNQHPLPFNVNLYFFHKTLQLFPNFHSRAVKAEAIQSAAEPTTPTDAITVATKTNTDIEHPLEIGFELTDTVTNTVLSQIFLNDTIAAQTDTLQGFSYEFPLVDNLSNINIDNTVVSPIFKYQGHIVHAAPANIMNDIFYSPIITAMANGGAYIVSGQPIIGSATFDERCFIVGNLMPIPGNVSAFKRTFTMVTGVLLQYDSMLGNWKNSDDSIDLKFNDDFTGTYNGEKFTYEINNPQTGDIKMSFVNNRFLLLTVVEQTENEIKIVFKNSDKIINLTR